MCIDINTILHKALSWGVSKSNNDVDFGGGTEFIQSI